MDGETPKGVIAISWMFVAGAILNLFLGISGSGQPWWFFVGVGVAQLIVAARLYGLNKRAYQVVVVINYVALFLSGLVVVRGLVQMFQSKYALVEVVIFLPSLLISLWIAAYLKRKDVKRIFT